MNEDRRLHSVEQFQGCRSHLLAIAYRLLGSLAEAEDAVQETWLRLSRTDPSTILHMEAWLTTVVARVGLDMLRLRSTRKEAPEDDNLVQNDAALGKPPTSGDPEQEALLAESVGLALLVVLDRLTPAERVSFVMHDVFALSFEELAPILDRTPAAVRQLASRARRRMQGRPEAPDALTVERRVLVRSFLAALRAGDLNGLLAVLDPNLVVRIDASAAIPGQPRTMYGAETWAKQAITVSRGARFTEPAWVDGELGVVVVPAGKLLRVLKLSFQEHRIASVEVVSDTDRLERLAVALDDVS